MKLHAGSNIIEKSNLIEDSKFSIEASSKAFFILSDGLYSNKIKAVIRELSTNAYDSHVEADKKDIPFDVHIPSRINPTFYVRDYGTSMNHEQCMQLYTTYFRSTRNNSNDAVGCLGLGSKAPFAYTDSFTVEAYLSGSKRIYTGYKDSDGSPVFSLLDEVDTDEPDGIKVSISVNEYDINSFNEEAATIYKYFNVKPNFVNNVINFRDETKILTGSNWYFAKSEYDNLVIMGQIAYPLNNSHFTDKYNKFLSNTNGLRLFVNIGDVDITPSRESLSYSNETKKNLCNIIDVLISEIAEKIQSTINEQPSLYKARIEYIYLNRHCQSIGNAIETLQGKITWNNEPIFDNMSGEYIEVKNKLDIKNLYRGSYRKKIDTDSKVERFYFTENISFVIDDLKRGGLTRTKEYMKLKPTGNSVSIYFYTLGKNETIENCELYDILGCSKEDIILTSSMPKKEYNRSSGGGAGGPVVQCLAFNEENGKFEECKMSVNYENANYFLVSKDDVSTHGGEISTSHIENIISLVLQYSNEDLSDMNFYLVKPFVANNRKLDERHNWYDGNKTLQNLINKIIENNEDKIDLRRNYIRMNSVYSDRIIEGVRNTKSDNNAKNILNSYDEYVKQKEINNGLNYLYGASSYFDCKEIKNISDKKYNFDEQFNKAMEKYPMLKVCHIPYYDGDSSQVVSDYIDLIEQIV
jgi:hypothetical protein